MKLCALLLSVLGAGSTESIETLPCGGSGTKLACGGDGADCVNNHSRSSKLGSSRLSIAEAVNNALALITMQTISRRAYQIGLVGVVSLFLCLHFIS